MIMSDFKKCIVNRNTTFSSTLLLTCRGCSGLQIESKWSLCEMFVSLLDEQNFVHKFMPVLLLWEVSKTLSVFLCRLFQCSFPVWEQHICVIGRKWKVKDLPIYSCVQELFFCAVMNFTDKLTNFNSANQKARDWEECSSVLQPWTKPQIIW